MKKFKKRKDFRGKKTWSNTEIYDNATCGCSYLSKKYMKICKICHINIFIELNLHVGTEVPLDMNCAIVSALLISLIW